MKAVENSLLFPHPDWPRLIGKKSPLILDVGSNDGGSSYAFFKVFPLARIFAFECEPRAIDRFLIRLNQNPDFAERTVLIQKAVSKSAGVQRFFCSDGFNPNLPWYESGWDLSGSLKEPISQHHIGLDTVFFERHIEVPVTSLDECARELKFLTDEYPLVDLLWIDVQGAELDVFRGARDLLKVTKFIHCECMKTEVYKGQPQAEELLKELGLSFKLLARYDNDLLFISSMFL
jgi:2-O-methyltransferase